MYRCCCPGKVLWEVTDNEKMGFNPIQMIDYKAMIGDNSDNLEGVKGIGPKTATKIIKEYGSIENAYAHADEIKPAKYGKLLNYIMGFKVTISLKLLTSMIRMEI